MPLQGQMLERLTIRHKHQVTSALNAMKCRRGVFVKEKFGCVISSVPSAVNCMRRRQQRPQFCPMHCVVDCVVVPMNWRATASWSDVKLELACGRHHARKLQTHVGCFAPIATSQVYRCEIDRNSTWPCRSFQLGSLQYFDISVGF